MEYAHVYWERRTCDCLMWQQSSIPCKHAMGVARHKSLVGKDQSTFLAEHCSRFFVSEKEKNRLAEAVKEYGLYFVQVREMGGGGDLLPQLKKEEGMKKEETKRIFSKGEKKQYKCSLCGNYGHNSRGCPQLR